MLLATISISTFFLVLFLFRNIRSSFYFLLLCLINLFLLLVLCVDVTKIYSQFDRCARIKITHENKVKKRANESGREREEEKERKSDDDRVKDGGGVCDCRRPI